MTSTRLDEIKLRLARGDFFEDDRLDIAWLLRQMDEAEKRIEELGQHEVSQGIIEARGEEYVHVDLVAAKVAAAKAEGAREERGAIVAFLRTISNQMGVVGGAFYRGAAGDIENGQHLPKPAEGGGG